MTDQSGDVQANAFLSVGHECEDTTCRIRRLRTKLQEELSKTRLKINGQLEELDKLEAVVKKEMARSPNESRAYKTAVFHRKDELPENGNGQHEAQSA